MGRNIGYARVSSTDQDLSVQRSALEKAECGIIFEEKITGTKRDGREKLDLAVKVLAEGDTLVVTRLDRLGRSLRDLANIAHEIEEKGAALRVLEQNVNTKTSSGRAFFGMLATFAQFETDVRRERQAEGIARAKRNGERRADGRLKYAGRKPTINRAVIIELHRQGNKPSAIADRLGISRMSVWRALKDMPASAELELSPQEQQPPTQDPHRKSVERLQRSMKFARALRIAKYHEDAEKQKNIKQKKKSRARRSPNSR